MHINVDTKPVTPNTYESKKKRLIETIDRLYHRDASRPAAEDVGADPPCRPGGDFR